MAQTLLFGAFGIQVGSYQNRPTPPANLQQMGVGYEIIEQDGFFKLIVGPFNTTKEALEVKNSYNISGFLTQYTSQKPVNPPVNSAGSATPSANNFTNAPPPANNFANRATGNNQTAYAVEILSAKDRSTIPMRIIEQIFALGLEPKFVVDQGLYRLIVGPLSSAGQAQEVNARITSAFGRSMFTINLPANRFVSAIPVPRPTPEQMRQDALNISSNDKNEHLGYLENQRQRAISKYNTNPYGPTFQNSAKGLTTPTIPLSPSQNPLNMPEPQMSMVNPNVHSASGYLVSVAAMSSKNDLMVNGKQIGGMFSMGLQLGYKFNDNTLLKVSYFAPEVKTTSVFLDNNQSTDIKSQYDYMSSVELQYRYFLPTYAQIFLTSNFGINFVKQSILSLVPINFGKSYVYEAYYAQPSLGLGAGYRINRRITFGIDYNAYFTFKTVTSNVKFYLNYEI